MPHWRSLAQSGFDDGANPDLLGGMLHADADFVYNHLSVRGVASSDIGHTLASTFAESRVDWDRVFHCTKEDGFNGPLTLSHAALVLASLCMIGGIIGSASLAAEGAENTTIVKAQRAVNPVFKTVAFYLSIFGGCVVYVYSLFANTMVIIGFAYCQYYVWMTIAIAIVLSAQLWMAYEYAEYAVDPAWTEWIERFLVSLLQARVFTDAHESYLKGRVTVSFARHKFLQGVTESGPLAIFAVCVLFYLDQNHNFWLVMAICSSIIGVSWGISTWLEFSFNAQLEELEFERQETPPPVVLPRQQGADNTETHGSFTKTQSEKSFGRERSEPGAFGRTSTGGSDFNIWSEGRSRLGTKCSDPDVPVPVVIMWYHKVLWICYFCLDYALRLLTLGIFLSTTELKAFHAPCLSLLLVAYFLAVALPIQLYEEQGRQPEFWQIGEHIRMVERQVVLHRISDGLIMAFLVHILPADIRMAPKASQESRALLTLDPDVRRRIMNVVVPLRSFDYALLGGSAMIYHFDKWQCLALATLYISMHVLLASVLVVQSRMSQRFGTDHQVVPAAVLEEVRRMSDGEDFEVKQV